MVDFLLQFGGFLSFIFGQLTVLTFATSRPAEVIGGRSKFVPGPHTAPSASLSLLTTFGSTLH